MTDFIIVKYKLKPSLMILEIVALINVSIQMNSLDFVVMRWVMMRSKNFEMWNINKQISYLKTCLVRIEFWCELDVMIDVIQFQSTELECEKSFNLRHHVNMIRPRLQDSSELISDVST